MFPKQSVDKIDELINAIMAHFTFNADMSESN